MHDTTTISISCVIPTHSRPDFLRDSLESVRQQSRQPEEVIVVSDCIDEPSREVCSDFKAGGMNITYIESDTGPGGASASRNRGAANSSSSFIAFLDDDDKWAPDYLSDAAKIISNAGIEIVVTWLDVFSGDSVFDGPRVPRGLKPSDAVGKNHGTTGSNIVVSRRAFDSIAGFDENLRTKNDTDFFYRSLQAGIGYSVVERVGVLQRKHQQGQLTGKSETRARGHEMYMKKHWSALSLSDKRDLRLAIHRIRRVTATSRLKRLAHTGLAVLNYSPRRYIEERKLRHVKEHLNTPGFVEG